ncbi:MAG TPA: TraC family protein, partial [Noviherbaspirillum sp.]
MSDSLHSGLRDIAGSRAGIRKLLGLHGDDESPAEQFASWLPYSAYIGTDALFVNRDSIGFMLEVMPQSGADERMVEVLIS